MEKTVIKKNTARVEVSAQQYIAAADIKQRFIGEAFNLGWRLVVTFIVPVAIGIWLDRRFDSKPACTLVGMFLAIAASVVVIQKTVKEVNEDLASSTAKKRNKNA